jgi:hypothetical protein
LLLALVFGVAAAQSDPCEGLQGATPGLYELCVVFHDVEPCVPNPLARDPFAACEPKDGRLLAAYNELKGPDDPRMPETAEVCPCFSASQLEGSMDPEWYDLVCWTDCPWAGGAIGAWAPSVTAVFHNDASGATDWLGYAEALLVGNAGRKESHACWYVAPGEPTVLITSITYADYMACRDIVAATIELNTDRCATVCTAD